MNNNNLQSSLFNDTEIKLEYQKNLINVTSWKLPYQLKQELEVIGFYFSDHPLSIYSEKIFEALGVTSYEQIMNDKKSLKAKVVGAVLDIKERTSKDGNKYAFITISDKNNQYDITIFGDTFRNYYSLINEGSVLIFNIDIQTNNQNSKRFIVKEVQLLDKVLSKKIFNHFIYLDNLSQIHLIKEHIKETNVNTNKIFVSLKKNNSKICISFNKNLTIANEERFNNLLKTNNILRTITLSN